MVKRNQLDSTGTKRTRAGMDAKNKIKKTSKQRKPWATIERTMARIINYIVGTGSAIFLFILIWNRGGSPEQASNNGSLCYFMFKPNGDLNINKGNLGKMFMVPS
ncbi:predicted protein [Histoplasma capsulatum var. duboisii H88]|uniref:Predicted protein n=2 Tax=Ajellomyces capsulatus TaxID=5037 RepID=F0UHR5_AJEC8|nr:predicted protein [Histoplasma capsulatum H143]EGC46274.1 predicted protein [Histoplasma capsulatum var. duboisii H88]